ncbi:hypothetical protein Tco_0075666, partial [Tanacetum coccineum]
MLMRMSVSTQEAILMRSMLFYFDEIDAFLDIDVPMDIKDGYHDSKGDKIYFESFLINDTFLNLHSEVFLDHDPRSLEDEPDKDDLKNIVK